MEETRDWTTDVLDCIQHIESDVFTLQEVYKFEGKLSNLYPNNKNIKAKIRQILQVLRDSGTLEFIDNQGNYKKINKNRGARSRCSDFVF